MIGFVLGRVLSGLSVMGGRKIFIAVVSTIDMLNIAALTHFARFRVDPLMPQTMGDLEP